MGFKGFAARMFGPGTSAPRRARASVGALAARAGRRHPHSVCCTTGSCSARSRSPLIASDFSRPRMKPTTTKMSSTTTVSAASVNALRIGLRN